MTELHDLLPAYRAALQARGQCPRGIEPSLLLVRRFADWVAATAMDQATPLHPDRYHEHLAWRWSHASVRVSQITVQCFVRWAGRGGYLANHLTDTVGLPCPRASHYPVPECRKRGDNGGD